MIISGNFTVAAPQAQVFDHLKDAGFLAKSLPGCREMQQTGPETYAGKVDVSVAFMKLSFQIEARIQEAQAPDYLVAEVTGKPASLPGNLKMTARLNLAESSVAETTVSYDMDIHLSGRLGSLGESAIRPQAAKMSAEFANNVKARLEA